MPPRPEPACHRGHHRVTGTRRVAGETRLEPGPDHVAVAPDQHQPVRPERHEHVASTVALRKPLPPATGSSSPVAAASSRAFGLTMSGRPAMPRGAPVPRVHDGAPPRVGGGQDQLRVAVVGKAPRHAPGSHEHVVASAGSATRRRTVESSADHSGRAIVGPGSLNAVASPSASDTTVTVRRVSWSASTRTWGMPRAARSVRTSSPVTPPTTPTAVAGLPRTVRTDATLIPLPPAIALGRSPPGGSHAGPVAPPRR